MAINLSKQQFLNANQKPILHIISAGNVKRVENTTMFFIIEERNRSGLLKRNCDSIINGIYKFILALVQNDSMDHDKRKTVRFTAKQIEICNKKFN